MGPETRRKKNISKTGDSGVQKENRTAKTAHSAMNRARREKYRNNEDYRARAKQRARSNYNPKTDPKDRTPKTAHIEPEYKEVVVEGTDEPTYAYVYTIPNLARVLNRTPLTVKRWIQEGTIPKPIITDTARNYKHYSVGEYELLRDFLRRREVGEGLQYFNISQEDDIERLYQRFEGYRKHNV